MHDALMDRLEALLAGQEVPPPGAKLLFAEGGTVNFWTMAVAGEYLRAFRVGTVAERREIRERVIEMFERQRRDGFMCRGKAIEQCCPDPHTNFHLVSVAAIYLGAVEFDHPDVLRAAKEWIGGALALWELCSSPDGEVFIPGTRAKGAGAPRNELATMVLRELRGLRHTGAAAKDGEDEVWSQRYYAGARLWRDIFDSKGFDLVSVGSKLPRLRIPLTILRTRGGYVARLARPAPDLGKLLTPVDWIAVTYGRPGKHRVEHGRDWKTEPPILEAKADVIACPTTDQ